MSNIIQTTAFMYVDDLDKALEFFTEVLGFSVDFRQTNYAYVSREGAGLRILEDPNRVPEVDRRFAYYFDCRDVDALYAEFAPKLSALPSDYVHGPTDKPYNQRELLIRAPDGLLIAFGQGIGPNAAQWDE